MGDNLLDDKTLRKIILQSLFLEDILAENLTLKGAQSLALLEVGNRTTRDLDFSATLDTAKENLEDIFRIALEKGFEENEAVLVKWKFNFQPRSKKSMIIPNPLKPDEEIIWGGYNIKLGALSVAYYQEKKALQQKKGKEFKPEQYANNAEIDISFGEYTKGRIETDVEGVSVFVYTPLMTVYEKARASAQQLKEYKISSVKTRSRDIYDIYQLLKNENLNIKDNMYKPENIEILKNMFQIKGVDTALLNKISDYEKELTKDFQDNVTAQIPQNSEEQNTFHYMFYVVNEMFKKLYEETLKV